VRSTAITILLLLGSVICRPALALQVQFDQRDYAPGEAIVATVDAVGTVGIDSELSQNSRSVDVAGEAQVEVGAVGAPGVFVVRMVMDQQVYSATLFLLPEGDDQLRLTVVDFTGKGGSPQEDQTELLQRFWQALTKDRLATAFNQVWPDWLAKNAVNTGTTGLICMLPANGVACGLSVAGEVIDLGSEVFNSVIDSMVIDGVLTDSEGAKLKLWLGLGNLGAQTLLPEQRLERAIALVSGGLELIIDNPDAKVTFHLSTDELRKFYILCHIDPKLP
jgi:hypothetical protein